MESDVVTGLRAHFRVVRDLELTVPGSASGTPPAKITHLHFTAWPNYGVPEHAGEMAKFLQLTSDTIDAAIAGEVDAVGDGDGESDIMPVPETLVEPEGEIGLSDLSDDELDGYILRDEEVEVKESVWVEENAEYLIKQEAKQAQATLDNGTKAFVHCSGGVGRSGTFLSVLVKWRQLQAASSSGSGSGSGSGSRGSASLVPIVTKLREQRHPWAVEGFEQYQFAYQLLAHLIAGVNGANAPKAKKAKKEKKGKKEKTRVVQGKWREKKGYWH